jgi:hypothetical protein
MEPKLGMQRHQRAATKTTYQNQSDAQQAHSPPNPQDKVCKTKADAM